MEVRYDKYRSLLVEMNFSRTNRHRLPIIPTIDWLRDLKRDPPLDYGSWVECNMLEWVAYSHETFEQYRHGDQCWPQSSLSVCHSPRNERAPPLRDRSLCVKNDAGWNDMSSSIFPSRRKGDSQSRNLPAGTEYHPRTHWWRHPGPSYARIRHLPGCEKQNGKVWNHHLASIWWGNYRLRQ